MAWNLLLPLLSAILLQVVFWNVSSSLPEDMKPFHYTTIVDDTTTDIPISTKKGQIVGKKVPANSVTNIAFDAFLGIPYGDKPDRFQLAKARTAWTTVLPTQADGPVCPQPNTAFSEDCLYLNVFTPSGASDSASTVKYPVMVFVPGEGFIYSSPSSKIYGPDFLIGSNIILVTVGYRVGAAGFLSLGSKQAPGNLGLHDVLLALHWVQDEIALFGGDVSRVTLFGSGAGSVITQFHYLSPLSTGLFHRAITQSGSALASWGVVTPTEARRRALQLAQNLKCDTQNDNNILSCLQKADIKDILSNQFLKLSEHETISGRDLPFVAVLDTNVTADKPFFANSLDNLMKEALARKKPLLSGFTSDEGVVVFNSDSYKKIENNLAAFLPDEPWNSGKINSIKKKYFNDSSPTFNKVQSLVSIYTDYLYANPAVKVSRTFENFTYGYQFAFYGNWKSRSLGRSNKFYQFKMQGVAHGVDLSYIFYSSDVQSLENCQNSAEIKIKNNMVAWWTNFAKNGVPDDSWPTIAKEGYYVIDSKPFFKNVTVFEDQYYNFWASMQVKSSSYSNSAAVNLLTFLLSLTAVITIFYL